MRLRPCPWEKEVAALLQRGQWPDSCPAEIRAHVDGCKGCRDLALVTQALRRERAAAAGAARLEPAGVLWWRAQLRRRNQAMARIARPMLGAQLFAVAVALVAATVFLVAQLEQNAGWLSWLQELPRSLHLDSLLPAPLQNAGLAPWLLLAVLGGVVFVSGVLVYRFSDDR